MPARCFPHWQPPISSSRPSWPSSPAATQPETASAEAEAVGEQTASGDAAGLIAEIGADSVAAAGQVDAGRYDRTQNPLLAVLDPSYAGGAAIGAAYKADMAAVNEYLANPAVRELFPADIDFKWGVKGDDKIDGRYYLYAIKGFHARRQGSAGRVGRDERHGSSTPSAALRPRCR